MGIVSCRFPRTPPNPIGTFISRVRIERRNIIATTRYGESVRKGARKLCRRDKGGMRRGACAAAQSRNNNTDEKGNERERGRTVLDSSFANSYARGTRTRGCIAGDRLRSRRQLEMSNYARIIDC